MKQHCNSSFIKSNKKTFLREIETGLQVINDDTTFERTRKSFWVTLPTWLIIIDRQIFNKTLNNQKVNFTQIMRR
jgi:hypothetical protein